MANRLAEETSPYLLQHAQNPVDWYPWGPEALERARAEDRPILLSIGYSACHWCHVMERESFEDQSTAAVMNDGFVNIKVDREERPDLDSVYMKAVQAMTGQGGWPLTAFLTPEGVPFFGGTYFPPEPRHGMPSFGQVLDAAGKAYRDRPAEVLQAGAQLREMLDRSSKEAHPISGETREFTSATVESIVAFAAQSYDAVHGGFGGAPKFPQPVVLDLLLRSGADDGPAGSGVAMAIHTLKRMAAGGMRDHLGGGFHRYSVDAKWLVPHFEKMLYDNALLARTYAHASLATGDSSLGRVATEVLGDMIDDLGSDEGPFYSARDADSEGEEGTFYLWTPGQLSDALDPDVARLFGRCYDVSDVGNFEGKNILHLPHDLDAVARDEGMSRDELDRELSDARQVLKGVRAERVAPLLDDKVLTSWNGMAIRAFSEVGAALNRPDLLARAQQAATFVLESSAAEGQLFHVYGGDRHYIPGFLEDYGAMGNACISLFEATLESRWIQEAEWMANRALDQFWSDSESAFYDAAVSAEALVVRPRDIMDNATPSGNSLIVELLLRLSALTGAEELREPAIRVLARELGVIQRYPTAVARLAVAGILAHTPKLEVTLVGGPEGVGPLLEEAHRHFHPNRVISGGDPSHPRIRSMPALEGRTNHVGSAFVCVGSACQAPVDSVEELAGQLVRTPG